MDTLQVLNQQNAVFGTELKEIGERVNMLNMDSMCARIKNGLDVITKEGWLSEKEHQALSQKIPNRA